MISSISSNAITGIQRGMNDISTQAKDIASAGALSHPPTKDITSPLINMIPAQAQVEASVKVLQAEDKMLGAILDVKA